MEAEAARKSLTALKSGQAVIGGIIVERIGDRYRLNFGKMYSLDGAASRLSMSMPRSTSKAKKTAQKTAKVSSRASSIVAPIYPDWLRCLSVAGGYGWLLCKGYKAEEYREWQTSHRGLTLIHVSTGKGYDQVFKDMGIPPSECPKTAIIGAVNVIGCIGRGDGVWGHVVDNPILFDKPIMGVKGSFKYWKPRPTDYNEIRAFNEAWGYIKEAGLA